MLTLIEEYQTFLDERRFLMNVTDGTLRCYQSVGKLCLPLLPENASALTIARAQSMIRTLRERDKSASGTNVCIRCFNTFFKWLQESGRTPASIHLSYLKTEKKVLPTYSEQHLKAILDCKPDNVNHQRIRALFVLTVDIGARLSETRTLKRTDLNMEQCLVKLYGKGRKERIVPFSPDARKILYRWMTTHAHEYVFATRTGSPVSNRNAQRDLNTLWDKLRLPHVEMVFHAARRTFATTYAKRGGDLFRLQQQLGHANLETTRRYVNLSVEDLASCHAALSPLNAIRR